MSCKKIGIDFHGVINTAPQFFADFTDFLHKQGIKIYIISGGPREYIEKYLAQYNILYDFIWCIFDYFNDKEKVEVAADGSFHIDDELWNAAKGEFCAREKINLHIDDSSIYGKYFITPYVRYNESEKLFEQQNKVVTVIEDPQSTAQKLLEYMNLLS